MGTLVAAPAVAKGWIDAHAHIWTRDVEKYPLRTEVTLDDLDPPSFTAEELLATVQPLGVTRVVLIQHRPFHGVDNSYLTDTLARYQDVFSIVACLDEQSPTLQGDMQRLQEQGVRGIRIRPGEGGAPRWRDSDAICSMWKLTPTVQMAICPLINPEDLQEVDHMCRRFPDTAVVVDHFARVGIDGTFREQDVENLLRLARHNNTHVKLSAFYALGNKRPPHDELIPMIRRLSDAFGPERLMWASDAPYQLQGMNTYQDSLTLVTQHIDFLSSADKEWILRRTAEKVFFS